MMSKKIEIMPFDVKEAVAKIKRRKGINGNKDVSVSMIAAELRCSRNVLYKSSLNKVMEPFKKIKLNKKNNSDVIYGTIEYYKKQLKNKKIECDKMKAQLDEAKNQLIDIEVFSENIILLEEENQRIRDKLSRCQNNKEIDRLVKENKTLRRRILQIGFKK